MGGYGSSEKKQLKEAPAVKWHNRTKNCVTDFGDVHPGGRNPASVVIRNKIYIFGCEKGTRKGESYIYSFDTGKQ